MNDVQHQEDINKAHGKLQDIQNAKAARNDPRAGEETGLPPRRTAPDGSGVRPVKGKPKNPEKTFGQEFKEAMFGENIGNGSVPKYVFFKIFIPNFKRLLGEIANSTINIIFGLDSKTKVINAGANQHQANASAYRDRNFARQQPVAESSYGRMAISEYEWDGDTAKDIFQQMIEQIELYGKCSLATAYVIMDMPSKILTTDRNWGWTSTREISLEPADPIEDRWFINVTRPHALNTY